MRRTARIEQSAAPMTRTTTVIGCLKAVRTSHIDLSSSCLGLQSSSALSSQTYILWHGDAINDSIRFGFSRNFLYDGHPIDQSCFPRRESILELKGRIIVKW